MLGKRDTDGMKNLLNELAKQAEHTKRGKQAQKIRNKAKFLRRVK